MEVVAPVASIEGEIYRNVLDQRGSMSARGRPYVLEFRKVDYFEVVGRRAEGLPG